MYRSRITYRAALLFIISLGLVVIAHPAQAGIAGAFAKGKMHFTVFGGNGRAFNDDYVVFGASGRYFFANGFNVGLALETWTGGNPDINKLTPSVQYVFYQPSVVKPYIGAFYRRTYIENLEDLESVGARVGVYIAGGSNTFIGIGGVYESYLDCQETTYNSCDDSYPEISFSLVF